MTEKDIESYMAQFNVDRETAIREILETLGCYYKEEDKKMEETYNSIKRSMY